MAIEIFDIKDGIDISQIGNILDGRGISVEDITLSNGKASVRCASTISSNLKSLVQSDINGADPEYYSSDRGRYLKVENVNAGTGYAVYHSYTTKILGPGDYRIGWNYGFKINNTSTSGQGRILLDGEELHQSSAASRNVSDIHNICGFRYISLKESKKHDICLEVRQSSSSGKVTFQFACFEFELVY